MGFRTGASGIRRSFQSKMLEARGLIPPQAIQFQRNEKRQLDDKFEDKAEKAHRDHDGSVKEIRKFL